MKKDSSFQSREEDPISSRTDSPLSLISVPAAFEYVDEAISLLSYNPVSKIFTLNAEALEFLKSLGSPVSVISVAGLYRTGKSYLLNRVLLNRKSGFGVGPTINPCTKGIWLWGRPLNGSLPDGSPCSVVIVDTEGLGALDQDSDYDTRVFSLAVLISSSFLYNSVGTIDEDAIQKLSLVVNLTKHIQLKARNNEEAGSEEYAPFFPKFVWVLRDFTLKLVDEDGEPISAKEYLEIALKVQKGYSDVAEEKNRIRRLLKEFFVDRECFMMVRPVKGEESLQNLESKEFEELRYEFVEQVLALRKKMLTGISPKCMNGRPLTGEMLATLIETYVNAMNKGAVPSIESAWSYICKTECARALQDAQEVYEKVVMNSVSAKFPMHEEELRLLHQEAKKQAFEVFKGKAVGDDVNLVRQKLKDILVEKYANIKADNESESEKKSSMFLSNAYGTIDHKLRNNEYKNFLDFEKDIKKLQRFFRERGPEGPFREEILLEFCQKKILDTADYFLKESQGELSYLEDTFTEKVKLLESDLKDCKDEMSKERADWQRRLTSAESEKTEFSAKENSLREQLASLKFEKEKNEADSRNALKTIRTELGAQLETANSKAWEFEEKMKEIERLSLQKDSEFQEKAALMEQKVKYLESNLEESRRREKEYLNESRNQKKDHSSSLKDIQARFEGQIKTLQSRLEAETDRVTELEREIEEKDRNYERDKSFWEESEVKFKTTIEEKTNQLNSLTQESKKRDKEYSKQERKDRKEAEANSSKLSTRIEDLEKKLKSQEDSSKKEIQRLNQETAILTQKLEFSDQYLQETRAQLDEERKQHENMLKSLHGSSGLSTDDLEGQLEKVRQHYADETRLLEEKSDSTRRDLSKQIESLSQKNTELELELKCQTS
jgi:RNase P protein component